MKRRQTGENGAAVSSHTDAAAAAAKLQSKHNLAHHTRTPSQSKTLVTMKDCGDHCALVIGEGISTQTPILFILATIKC